MAKRAPAPATFSWLTCERIDEHAGDPNFMLSLARGLAVLSAFDEQHRALNIAQICERTHLPRAAVRRCLYTLSRFEFVSGGPEYQLLPKVLKLGFAQLASVPFAELAQPVLDRCRDELHQACSLGKLDADQVLYVARSERVRIMAIALRVGSRLPAYCTSMGRVLLAQLTEAELEGYLERVELVHMTEKTVTSKPRLREIIAGVARAGYAIVDQELEIGLRAIAVPVTSASGGVVGALNAGTPSVRVSQRELTQRFLPALRAAAEELKGLVLE